MIVVSSLPTSYGGGEVYIWKCFIIYWLFLSSVEGLHAIVVSDRDGVPVIKGKMPQLHVSAMFAFE